MVELSTQDHLDALRTIRTVDGFVEYVTVNGTPTEGALAEAVWRHLSGQALSYELASTIYSKCGYRPFVGYPLQRI